MLCLVAALAMARMSPETLARLDHDLDHLRHESARREAAAALAEDPSDLAAHALYIRAVHASGSILRRPLRETYRRWQAERPEDPVRRVVMGLLEPVDDDVDWASDDLPNAPGPWCDATLAWLDVLPSEADNRFRALWYRRRVLSRCERETAATDAEIDTLAATLEIARYGAAWIRADRGPIDQTLARGIAWVVGHQPWRVDRFTMLWDDDAAGPGLEAARRAVVDTATVALTRREPWLNDAGKRALAARDHGDGKPETWRETPLDRARQLIDPGARLAALQAAERDVNPSHRAEVESYWHVRHEAAVAVGDAEEAFRCLRRLATTTEDAPGSLAYVREAVARREHLWEAHSVASWAVGWLRDPGWQRRSFHWDPYRAMHRAELADALDARAAVRHLLRQDSKALGDAWEAVLLEGTPRQHLRLGISAHATGRSDLAFTELSRALSSGPTGDPADEEGMAALNTLWTAQSLWTPDGLTSWLSATEAVIAPENDADRTLASMRDPRVGTEFPDLAFTVRGEPRTISSYPGVVVVGLWASGCGPCKVSLPRVDALARRYAGKVTVLALSVDAREEDARKHLGASSPQFVSGYLGDLGMKQAGVTGIPVIFVLEAGRIVAVADGYRDADHRVDDAVAAALSR